MKSGIKLLAVVALTLLQGCLVVQAKSIKTETIVNASDKDTFAASVIKVKGEMLPGGRFEYIDSREREQVNTQLADMQSLFDKFGSVQQMDQASKVKLLNDQEAVNSTLTRRDDTRLICENSAPIGSHIPRTVCHTYSEIEQANHESQKEMQDTMKSSSNRSPGH